MALSEAQTLLANGLLTYGMPEDGMIGILLMLQKEPQQWALMEYMADNPEIKPGQILKKALELSGGPDEIEIVDDEEEEELPPADDKENPFRMFRKLMAELEEISIRKGFPQCVSETAAGTIEDSPDWDAAKAEVIKIMEEEPTARGVIRRLQPIIRKNMGE